MTRKSFLILVAVVILLAVAALFYFPALRSRIGLEAPAEPQALIDEVAGLDLGNLDAEFQAIDADLQNL